MPDPTCVLNIPWFSLPWDVDGGGTRLVEDLSGYGNHLTPSSFAGTDVEFAQEATQGQVCELDGAAKYLTNTAPSNLVFPCSLTIEALVYPHDSGGAETICSMRVDNSNYFNLYYHNTLGFMMQVDVAGTTQHTNQGSMPQVNLWYHVVGTYDSGAAAPEVYVNGVAQGNLTAASAVGAGSGTALEVGRRGDGTLFFDGYLGCLRIYTRTMGAAEILNRYQNRHRLTSLD